MKNKTLPYCICIFLAGAGVDVRAATVTPAYKLGDSYASDLSTTAKCLEGHAGSTLGNPDCRDMSDGCKSNSECVTRFGKDFVCAKGRDGNAKRGVCKYQECSGTGDTSCSTKYSHLRSCVKNEIGVFECRITCNWQKIKEAGEAVISSVNVADRMKFEYNLFKNPSNTSLLANNQAYLTAMSTTIYDHWWTCKNGKMQKCQELDLEITVPENQWDNGTGAGYKYTPCLPCSIATGGTYGIQADEDISHVGNYSYALATRATYGDMFLDLTSVYVNTGGAFFTQEYIKRCGNKLSYTVPHSYVKQNNSMPFTTRVNSSEKAKVERVGLRNAAELGVSDICMLWQNNSGEWGKYVMGTWGKGFCPDRKPNEFAGERWAECLKSTDLQQLVWVPKQNVTIRMPTALSASKGTNLKYFNFNQPYGTLLCCRLAAKDNSDVDAANKILRSCVAINPAN